MTETWMKEESNEREGEMRQRNRSRPRLIPYKKVGVSGSRCTRGCGRRMWSPLPLEGIGGSGVRKNVAWDVGENERGGCIKRSVGGA